MLKAILISTIVFFTLFPITFYFAPTFLSTRFIVASLGILVWFLLFVQKKKKIYNKFLILSFLILLISIWSIFCTVIFNQSYDYTYVTLPVTILVMFFSAYFCIYLISIHNKRVDFELVTKYFLGAILLQSLFVVVQFIDTDFASFLLNIQRVSERQLNISKFHLDEGSRFIGFGLYFYTASFFYGTALVLLTYQLRYKSINITYRFIYTFLYILFFLIGMGLSRSTVIGFLSSILVFLFSINDVKGGIKKIFKNIPYLLGMVFFIFIVIKVFPSLNDNFEGLIDNAFDFIFSYIEKGSLESESAKGTFDSFQLPNDSKTYIVGTGLYNTYYSVGDFNYSDIGYLRLLYYFGVPGLILFFLIEVKLLSLAFKRKGLLPIYYAMLIILFATSIKGLTTLAIISMLYLLIPNHKKSLKNY